MTTAQRERNKYKKWREGLQVKGGSKPTPKKTSGVASQSTKSLINSSSTEVATQEKFQPYVLNSKGQPTRDLTHKYNRSKFGDHKDIDYVNLRKTKENAAKPPPKVIISTDSAGNMIKRKSPEKIFAISETSGKQIKGRGQLDHIVPIHAIDQAIAPVSEFAPDFVQKKWAERPGGKRHLSAGDLKGLYTSESGTQWLSAQENIDKGAKRLSQYTKETGWGKDGSPQVKDSVGQAVKYKDVLLGIAKNFGKRGVMSRDDAKVYRDITGKEPEGILDAGMGSQYSPPAYYGPPTVGKDFIQKPVKRMRGITVEKDENLPNVPYATQSDTPHQPKPDIPLSRPPKQTMVTLPKVEKEVKEAKKEVIKKPVKKKKSLLSQINLPVWGGYRPKKKTK